MRNWILGGFLACLTSAGIAYVLAKNTADSHCGLCIDKPDETVQIHRLPPEVVGGRPKIPNGECEHCKGTPDKSGVVDVVDLDRAFLLADGTRPKIRFEEPPLAKPRGEVVADLLLAIKERRG